MLSGAHTKTQRRSLPSRQKMAQLPFLKKDLSPPKSPLSQIPLFCSPIISDVNNLCFKMRPSEPLFHSHTLWEKYVLLKNIDNN